MLSFLFFFGGKAPTSVPGMVRHRALLLGAALLLLAVAAPGARAAGDDATSDEPQPVAQMTLTMTDGAGKQTPVTATVLPDEDAAAAAVRFCFDKGLTQPAQVLDIVRYLKGALEGKEHEPDIEYLRTAGAYSRRAAESAKEESYSEAAAGPQPLPQPITPPCAAVLPFLSRGRAPSCGVSAATLPLTAPCLHTLMCHCGVADLVRALDRQGLDPQAKEKIERELGNVFRDLRKQREAEEKQRQKEEEMERRRLAEEAAEEEARLRKAADEEDWSAFSAHLKTSLNILAPGETPPNGPHVVSSIDLTLHKTGSNGNKEEIAARAQWHTNEDVSHAAFRFCR